ncbi:3-dehydroquinate synthase [Cesiribacter andamanensis]|uniref:3-dehydroquinate synthase n=1 Tax=Cesiribacter andamanensis AMV16 TaxID=1279009 RepID=M7NJX4_9BACT|nr:3-dehydroquinate synthase [Cesiribacter andamanensis]EMR02090.1 3-dehydroquinate synthase [Cesiribacter andamanensis AMV16]
MSLPPNLPEHVLLEPVVPTLRHLLSAPYSRLAVLTDTNTALHCYPLLREALPADHLHICVPAGEEHKILETCITIWQAMTQAGLDRKALMLNLGGGVITDMGGFCAATYKRGIRFINLPTTLLAQVDASIGGKLGIDFEGYKNHIGLFDDAEAVVIDPHFLKTLPERERRSGYAEVVKHALIADREQWEALQQQPWQELGWRSIIEHSIGIKAMIVARDPLERGLRKILNFGHTLGHALESYRLEQTPEKRLLHGEAIAAGMICESWLSWKKAGLPEAERNTIARYLSSVWPEPMVLEEEIPAVLDRLPQDKKNEGQQVLYSLLQQAGEASYNCAASQDEARQALEWYIKKGWQ